LQTPLIEWLILPLLERAVGDSTRIT